MNEEIARSSKFEISLIMHEPLMIELSDNEGSPFTWVEASNANFVEYLREVICLDPTFVNLKTMLFYNPSLGSKEEKATKLISSEKTIESSKGEIPPSLLCLPIIWGQD